MTFMTKIINKFPSTKSRFSTPDNTVPGRKKSDPNAIPPEPVQQQPQGNFRHQEQGPALSTLNFARANKRCGALTWDNQLADDAQKCAERVADEGGAAGAVNGGAANSITNGVNGGVNGGTSENDDTLLAKVSTADKFEDGDVKQEQGQCVFVHRAESADGDDGAAEPTYEDAIKGWLKEETKYNGEVVQDGVAEYKRYTQCMWSGSKHLGMGKAEGSNGTWYVVARFTPAGNITGERPFQVEAVGI